MSFDIDPMDRYKRILAYHPESDFYWLCTSQAEFDSYIGKGEEVDDVTDIEHHEEEYKKRMR